MKRIFAALLLTFAFCSCGAKVEEETLPAEYDADVEIRIDGAEYAAIYEKRLATDKLIFLAPQNLAGLEVLRSGEKVKATLGDFTLESAEFERMFAFLPVESFGEKTVGEREYLIKKRETQ